MSHHSLRVSSGQRIPAIGVLFDADVDEATGYLVLYRTYSVSHRVPVCLGDVCVCVSVFLCVTLFVEEAAAAADGDGGAWR